MIFGLEKFSKQQQWQQQKMIKNDKKNPDGSQQSNQSKLKFDSYSDSGTYLSQAEENGCLWMRVLSFGF